MVTEAISGINGAKLLNDIKNANQYFHKNMEDNKKFKNVFYVVKDSLIEYLLKGQHEDVSCNVSAIEVGPDNNVYAVINLHSGDITIEVHTPRFYLESHGIKFDTELTIGKYEKDLESYNSCDLSKEEFTSCFENMKEANRIFFVDKMKSLDVNTVISFLRNTSGTKPIVIDNKYVVFVSRKKMLPVYLTTIDNLIEGISKCSTYDFMKIYQVLKTDNTVTVLRYRLLPFKKQFLTQYGEHIKRKIKWFNCSDELFNENDGYKYCLEHLTNTLKMAA